MNIVVYINTEDNSFARRLSGVIRSKAPREHVEMISSFDWLKERLHRLPRLMDICVLVAATQDQLDEFIEQRDFLEGTIVFLIIPDKEKDTIARATKLYPSFMGTMDSNLAVIGSVLEKMIEFSRIRTIERPW